GVVTTDLYDFKDNPLRKSRQLAGDYQGMIDWSGSPTLETETFADEMAYDALDRVTVETLADQTEKRYGYNLGGQLEHVEGNGRGSTTATSCVADIEYDAKGRRTKLAYQNGSGDHVATAYSYDPLTFRLKSILTTRLVGSTTKKLQELPYYLDPVGNITH